MVRLLSASKTASSRYLFDRKPASTYGINPFKRQFKTVRGDSPSALAISASVCKQPPPGRMALREVPALFAFACCAFILPSREQFPFCPKMSDRSGAVAALAEIRGISRAQARRLFASGKVPGAYKDRDGWHFPRLSPEDVETIIKMHCAAHLYKLKHLLFPRLDEVLELKLVLANVTNNDIAVVMEQDPFIRKHYVRALKKRAHRKWKLLCRPFDLSNFRELSRLVAEPHVKLLTKARILDLHNYPVTVGNLAAVQNMPRSTFDRRYKRERDLIRRLCGDKSAGRSPIVWARGDFL
jgi:hypothetical protein